MPMELIVDKMYKNIKVELDESGDRKGRGFPHPLSRPRSAGRTKRRRRACAQVRQCSGAAIRPRSPNRRTTSSRTSLHEKKTALDDLEKQRLDIMTAERRRRCPSREQGLVAQLQGLHSQRRHDQQGKGDADRTKKAASPTRSPPTTARCALIEEYRRKGHGRLCKGRFADRGHAGVRRVDAAPCGPEGTARQPAKGL